MISHKTKPRRLHYSAKMEKGIRNYIAQGGKHLKKALVDAGYSKKTPTTAVTKRPSWSKLLTFYLPDDMMLKTHWEGLKAEKTIIGKDGEIINKPDFMARVKYLELGYKIKHKLTIDSGKGNTTNVAVIIKHNIPDTKEEVKIIN